MLHRQLSWVLVHLQQVKHLDIAVPAFTLVLDVNFFTRSVHQHLANSLLNGLLQLVRIYACITCIFLRTVTSCKFPSFLRQLSWTPPGPYSPCNRTRVSVFLSLVWMKCNSSVWEVATGHFFCMSWIFTKVNQGWKGQWDCNKCICSFSYFPSLTSSHCH